MRLHFCNHLYEELLRNQAGLSLRDYSFYPVKEMLIEVLNVAFEKKDYRSAFFIIYSTQGIALEEDLQPGLPGEELQQRHMCESFYSQAIMRVKAFWVTAISSYSSVPTLDQISNNNYLGDEDLTNHDILEANLISMLYCLRSKEVFVEIARSVLKSHDRFEDIKVLAC